MTLADFVKTVLIGIPIGVTVLDVFGYVARVDGVSMQPALNPNGETDYVLLDRLSVRLSEVTRGDVVSFASPKDPKQKLIKRIIGLEGDVINTAGYRRSIVTVPRGHAWVEGDNASNSLDSNIFGPIALGLIQAKAQMIVWPPSRWQCLKSEVPPSRQPVNLRMEY